MRWAIDGDGATCGETNALSANRLVVPRQSGDAKKYEGLVGAAKRLSVFGMAEHPFADAIHRHLVARHELLLDEKPADGGVGMTVMGVVVDAKHDAIFKPHAG